MHHIDQNILYTKEKKNVIMLYLTLQKSRNCKLRRVEVPLIAHLCQIKLQFRFSNHLKPVELMFLKEELVKISMFG